jgi:hypothetical protein
MWFEEAAGKGNHFREWAIRVIRRFEALELDESI